MSHSVDNSWVLEESGNNAKDTLVQYVPINAAVTSEINANNCACVLLKVPIGAQVLQHTLLQDLLHSYIFLIFAIMAGWQQGNCIRFCCKLMKLLVQCLSLPAQRLTSPSCRSSVAGNQTRHYWSSFQGKFHVG